MDWCGSLETSPQRLTLVTCFNPCYNGLVRIKVQDTAVLSSLDVLILVIVDYGGS